MTLDVGGSVGVNDDAGGAGAPNRNEDDARAPSFELKADDGDIGFNEVKKGPEVPQKSGVVGVGKGDGFCDGLPFVSGADKAASLDRHITWVGDGSVVFAVNGVEDAAEYAKGGGRGFPMRVS